MLPGRLLCGTVPQSGHDCTRRLNRKHLKELSASAESLPIAVRMNTFSNTSVESGVGFASQVCRKGVFRRDPRRDAGRRGIREEKSEIIFEAGTRNCRPRYSESRMTPLTVNCSDKNWRATVATALESGCDVNLNYFMTDLDTKSCKELAERYSVNFVPCPDLHSALFRKTNPRRD